LPAKGLLKRCITMVITQCPTCSPSLKKTT
jgi:hypothetical protein